MVIGVNGESGVNALRVVVEERREAQENATTQLQLIMAILVQEKLSKMKTAINNPAQASKKLKFHQYLKIILQLMVDGVSGRGSGLTALHRVVEV